MNNQLLVDSARQNGPSLAQKVTRMDYAKSRLQGMGHPAIATYKAVDFDRMIAETRPNDVIVSTIDRTHNIYIVRAMELGCNVVTEKPMTIDNPRCKEIFNAIERTGQKLRVTFNYRYAPYNTKVYELISAGAIGTVNSVAFQWDLNTSHGADYFVVGIGTKETVVDFLSTNPRIISTWLTFGFRADPKPL